VKVLYLSAWYPTSYDKMAGLFVQKHAQAVASMGADVCVLYAEEGRGWWLRMLKGWLRVRRDWGMPDVVQVNVLGKQGLPALWLKRLYHIPYIVVEHWSGYLPSNYSFRGGLHGWCMRHIARHASAILPVSRMLGQAMRDCGIENARWTVVHNVVDDFFYTPAPSRQPTESVKRLLHVSCFDERAKNVKGLLHAVSTVSAHRQDFTLTLVGDGRDYAQVREYAAQLHLPEGMVRFTGELTPEEVAQQMQQSDAFLLFSRYENAPVVLSECLAVGLPVISSRAGGIPEMVDETCSLLTDVENEAAFAQAIIHYLDHPDMFDHETIRRKGQAYSYEAVGQMLMNEYRQAIKADNMSVE